MLPLRAPVETDYKTREESFVGSMRRIASAVTKMRKLSCVGRDLGTLCSISIWSKHLRLSSACADWSVVKMGFSCGRENSVESVERCELSWSRFASGLLNGVGTSDLRECENGDITSRPRLGLFNAWTLKSGSADNQIDECSGRRRREERQCIPSQQVSFQWS